MLPEIQNAVNQSLLQCFIQAPLQNQKLSDRFFSQQAQKLTGINCCDVEQIARNYSQMVSTNCDLCVDEKTKGQDIGWWAEQFLTVHVRFLLEMIAKLSRTDTREVFPVGFNKDQVLAYLKEELCIAVQTARLEVSRKALIKPNMSSQAFAKALKALTSKVYSAITALSPNSDEFLCLYTGHETHAVYVNWTARDGGLHASLCNLGDGISNYHYTTPGQPVYTLDVESSNPFAPLQALDYCNNLTLAPFLSAAKAFPLIYQAKGAQYTLSEPGEIAQTHGNCVGKNYLLGMRQRFLTQTGNDALYRWLYLREIQVALGAYSVNIQLQANLCITPQGATQIANAVISSQASFNTVDRPRIEMILTRTVPACVPTTATYRPSTTPARTVVRAPQETYLGFVLPETPAVNRGRVADYRIASTSPSSPMFTNRHR